MTEATSGPDQRRVELSNEFNEARFAMEMAVYCILSDYEESLGLPARTMPRPDGKGGVVPEAVVPEEWLVSGRIL